MDNKNNDPEKVEPVIFPESVESHLDKKVGRPSPYNEELHVPLAKAVALLGGTDEVSAKIMGINTTTLYRWKVRYPTFRHAIESGKENQIKNVEDSLLKRAQGFTIKEEKLFVYEGEVIRAEVDKFYPPEPKAMQYYLNNRKGKYWKERHEVHVDTDITLKFDKEDEDL